MPLKRTNRTRNPLKNIAGGATRAPNVVGKLSSSHKCLEYEKLGSHSAPDLQVLGRGGRIWTYDLRVLLCYSSYQFQSKNFSW